MKKVLTVGSIVVVLALLVGAVAIWMFPGQAEAYGGRGGAAQGVNRSIAPVVDPVAAPALPVQPVTGIAPQELDETEAEALVMALMDEYKAWTVYDQVIDDFGAVRPFTSIQRAEEKHIDALVTLFERYGLDLPANTWIGQVPSFDTLAEACAAGVQAEIDNGGLYDELFTMTDNPDILQVFASLQSVSEEMHLPAFERCAP